MKKMMTIFAVVAIAMAVVSCSDNSPKGIVQQQLEAQKTIEYDDDVEFLKNHGTKKERERIAEMSPQELESRISLMNTMRKRYKDDWENQTIVDYEFIGDEVIVGNEATVRVKLHIGGTDDRHVHERDFHLVLEEDGNWYMKN